MPNYTYKCCKCHKEFTVNADVNKKDLIGCECGYTAERVFKAGNVCIADKDFANLEKKVSKRINDAKANLAETKREFIKKR